MYRDTSAPPQHSVCRRKMAMRDLRNPTCDKAWSQCIGQMNSHNTPKKLARRSLRQPGYWISYARRRATGTIAQELQWLICIGSIVWLA